jgi:hypothetical protein
MYTKSDGWCLSANKEIKKIFSREKEKMLDFIVNKNQLKPLQEWSLS